MGQPGGRVSRWEIDPANSAIHFAIQEMLIKLVRGQFTRFRGSIAFDEAARRLYGVEVEIDVDSIDTGNVQRDIHLRSGDFFDVETYPTILFASRQVEHLDGNHVRVIGDLRLHGVTRPVTLEGVLDGVERDPWGQTRAEFRATTEVKRSQFGLTWNRPVAGTGPMIGDTVRITLDIQAVKQG